MISDFVSYPLFLRDILNKNGKELYLFFDVKNFFRSFYRKDIIQNTLKEDLSSEEYITTAPLQFILSSLIRYKDLLLSDGIHNYKIIYFVDSGFSAFHRSIFSKYKLNRFISSISYYGNEYLEENFDSLDKDEKDKILFDRIYKRNLLIAYYLFNKIKNVYFVKLDNLDSDFVPYFLVNYFFDKIDNKIFVVFSNDHDFFQMLDRNNIFQVFKDRRGKIRYINKDNVIDYFMFSKGIKSFSSFDFKNVKCSSFFPMIYSISGDAVDNIPGIRGIGIKYAFSLVCSKDVDFIFGNMENIARRIVEGKDIFSDSFDVDKLDKNSLWYKLVFSKYSKDYISDVLVRSYKLFSFEYLSDWLNSRDTLNKKEWYRQIVSVFNKNSEYLRAKDIFSLLSEYGKIYIKKEDFVLLEV